MSLKESLTHTFASRAIKFGSYPVGVGIKMGVYMSMTAFIPRSS